MMENRRSQQSWKGKSAERIWACGMGAMLLLLFLFLAAVHYGRSYLILLAFLYGVLNLCVFTAAYFALSRYVNGILDALSDRMEDMTGGKERMEFPIAEDTVLSKLQGKLLKLYDILLSHKEREQTIRKQLDENIGNLVHQISTPITNLCLYVDFLRRDDLTAAEREKFLSCMEEQAQKLSWLGESFARISRLETGIIRLRPEKQTAEPVILNAVDQVLVKAEGKGMEISLSGETQAAALFDFKWTAEALFNVLDNAVKYGKSGSKIEIIVTDMTSYISILIRNQSEMSIPPEEYHQLFKRFYRGKTNAGIEGVGLGLYITRKILEDEKGCIKAETRPDGMTEFAVWLYKG